MSGINAFYSYSRFLPARCYTILKIIFFTRYVESGYQEEGLGGYAFSDIFLQTRSRSSLLYSEGPDDPRMLDFLLRTEAGCPEVLLGGSEVQEGDPFSAESVIRRMESGECQASGTRKAPGNYVGRVDCRG